MLLSRWKGLLNKTWIFFIVYFFQILLCKVQIYILETMCISIKLLKYIYVKTWTINLNSKMIVATNYLTPAPTSKIFSSHPLTCLASFLYHSTVYAEYLIHVILPKRFKILFQIFSIFTLFFILSYERPGMHDRESLTPKGSIESSKKAKNNIYKT